MSNITQLVDLLYQANPELKAIHERKEQAIMICDEIEAECNKGLDNNSQDILDRYKGDRELLIAIAAERNTRLYMRYINAVKEFTAALAQLQEIEDRYAYAQAKIEQMSQKVNVKGFAIPEEIVDLEALTDATISTRNVKGPFEFHEWVANGMN